MASLILYYLRDCTEYEKSDMIRIFFNTDTFRPIIAKDNIIDGIKARF